MPHAKGSIGTTNYVVTITAGHHQLNADRNNSGMMLSTYIPGITY